ncbi:MAG TPA: hypothetical protein VMA09_00305 [Candidatus Binataceae bacterium]|nr:hypothetical protein [Candidatus Binataceae bacterium]
MDSEYVVRLLTPHDAAEMPDLALQVYGEGYFHREVFDPGELLKMNAERKLTSAVGVDKTGRVVAHAALERPNLERFAKLGEAMVLAEHRNANLLGRIGIVLVQAALDQRVVGLYGEAVTHHVYSQKAAERYQSTPTGIRFGAWSLAGFKLDNFPQRLTPIVYFKYLTSAPKKILYVPDNHRALAREIYGRLGSEIEFGDARSSDSDGEVTFRYDADQRAGLIAVIYPGRASVRQVIQATRSLIDESGAEAVFVDVMIDEPSAPQVCLELERAGFFFSGIQPHVNEDRDLLRLQIERKPIDLKLVETASEFARTLLDYIARERDRIAR